MAPHLSFPPNLSFPRDLSFPRMRETMTNNKMDPRIRRDDTTFVIPA